MVATLTFETFCRRTSPDSELNISVIQILTLSGFYLSGHWGFESTARHLVRKSKHWQQTDQNVAVASHWNVTEYTEFTFLQCCFWWPFKSVLATELANVSTWIFSYSGFNFSSSNFCSALQVVGPGFYDSRRSCREKYQPIISYWICVNKLSDALNRLLTRLWT